MNDRCPICNCDTQVPHTAHSAYLVCTHCGEILYPHERVAEANEETRLKYAEDNGYDEDYGLEHAPATAKLRALLAQPSIFETEEDDSYTVYTHTYADDMKWDTLDEARKARDAYVAYSTQTANHSPLLKITTTVLD